MDSWPGILFPFRRHPAYGGFVYKAAPRLARGVNVRPPRDVARSPNGTLRNSKMDDLRIGFVYLSVPRLLLGVKKNKVRHREEIRGRNHTVSPREDYGGLRIRLRLRSFENILHASKAIAYRSLEGGHR